MNLVENFVQWARTCCEALDSFGNFKLLGKPLRTLSGLLESSDPLNLVGTYSECRMSG